MQLLNQCPVFINRRQAETADIVIVNHHLPLADVAVRQAVGWKKTQSCPCTIIWYLMKPTILKISLPIILGIAVTAPHSAAVGLYTVRTAKPRTSGRIAAKFIRYPSRKAISSRDSGLAMLPQLRMVDEAAVKYFAVLEEELFQDRDDSDTVLIPYSGLEQGALLESYDRFFTSLVTLKTQLENLISLLEPDEGDKLTPYLKRIEAVIADLEFLMEAADEALFTG